MKPPDVLEEALAAEEIGNLEADQGIFAYPRWRITVWIAAAWGAIVFVGWAFLFRSPGTSRLQAWLVIGLMIVNAIWVTRGLRRVRIVGADVIAEYGFGKPSRSWPIGQLAVPGGSRLAWSGQVRVVRRDTGDAAFSFSSYLCGWKMLVARISAAGGAA